MIFEKLQNGNILVTDKSGYKRKLNPALNVLPHPHKPNMIVITSSSEVQSFTPSDLVFDYRDVTTPNDFENRNDAINKLTEHFFFSLKKWKKVVTEEFEKTGYSALYNWFAVDESTAHGGFIEDFTVPTDAQWTAMTDYVNNNYNVSPNNFGVGNHLKSCRQVNSPLGGDCDTSVHPRFDSHGTHYGRNSVGLSALPGGIRAFNGDYNNLGLFGYWWSSSEDSSTTAWYRGLGYTSGNVFHNTNNVRFGFSVLCVRPLTVAEQSLDDGTFLNNVQDYDGNTYQVVKIGDLAWTAENLRTTHYADGTPIPNVTDDTDWENLTTGAYSWYDNNIETAGIVYTDETIKVEELYPVDEKHTVDAKWIKNLPSVPEAPWEVAFRDFRVPTETEWDTERLTWSTNNRAGGFGSILKLPASGIRYFLNGAIVNSSSSSRYWSSTVDGTNSRAIYIMATSVTINSQYNGNGFSVRLIKDGIFTTENYIPQTITIGGLIYNTVFNEVTGRVWLDRNLGATQVATSYNDSNSYGWLYQWGRSTDGHQIRTSSTTTTLSDSDTPEHNSFIMTSDSPYDWRDPQNPNLWQGVNSINNPAPVAEEELEPNNKTHRVDAKWIKNLPGPPDVYRKDIKRTVETITLPKNYTGQLDLTTGEYEIVPDVIIINQATPIEENDEIEIDYFRFGSEYKETVLYFRNLNRIRFTDPMSSVFPGNKELLFYGYHEESLILTKETNHIFSKYQNAFTTGITPPIKCGYHYNHFAVRDARNIAPEGWRVPTKADFDALVAFQPNLGEHLQVLRGLVANSLHPLYAITFFQQNRHLHAGDIYGFNGQATGGRAYNTGVWSGAKAYSYYWSSTPGVSGHYFWLGLAMNDLTHMQNFGQEHHGFSLRLIKEDPGDWQEGDFMMCNSGVLHRTCKIGNQVWMGDNLSSKHFRNGDEIPLITVNANWPTTNSPARGLYNNSVQYR